MRLHELEPDAPPERYLVVAIFEVEARDGTHARERAAKLAPGAGETELMVWSRETFEPTVEVRIEGDRVLAHAEPQR